MEAEVIYPTPVERKQIDAGELARAIPKARREAADEAAIADGKSAMAAWTTRRGRRRAFSVTCGNGARIAQMITQVRATRRMQRRQAMLTGWAGAVGSGGEATSCERYERW